MSVYGLSSILILKKNEITAIGETKFVFHFSFNNTLKPSPLTVKNNYITLLIYSEETVFTYY